MALNFAAPILRAGQNIGIQPPQNPVLPEEPVSSPVANLLHSIGRGRVGAPINVAPPTVGPVDAIQQQQNLLNLATSHDLHDSMIHALQNGMPAQHYQAMMQNLAGRLAARHALAQAAAHKGGNPVTGAPIARAANDPQLWEARHPYAVAHDQIPDWVTAQLAMQRQGTAPPSPLHAIAAAMHPPVAAPVAY